MKYGWEHKLIVYLAGKVGGDKWKIEKAVKHPFVQFYSSDRVPYDDVNPHVLLDSHDDVRDNHGCPKKNFSDEELSLFIERSFVIPIEYEIDILIAYLDTPDSFGSIAEIAFASAKKIPCFLFIKNYGEYIKFWDSYWFISCFPWVQSYEIKNIKEYLNWGKQNLGKMFYKDKYLTSDHWQETRKNVLDSADNRCQLCNSNGELHVHHRTYDNLWYENLNDLIVLCKKCHKRFHDKF